MQDLPGAPGTARQGRTRIIVSTNDGGVATQPRAPGHGRPLAAQRAARHGRLSADSGAPGADVPLATTARAPGQHCLSAAPRAPGHERHRWPLRPQRAASHHRPSAAPIATVPLPAGVHRLCQGFLPRVPANPRTLIYPHSDRLNRHSRFRGESTSPRSNGGTTGGLRTGNLRCVLPNPHPPTIPHHPLVIPAKAGIQAFPPHHPSSASCRPSTAPPAALLHRVYGLPSPPPLPRPSASSLRRKPQSSPVPLPQHSGG